MTNSLITLHLNLWLGHVDVAAPDHKRRGVLGVDEAKKVSLLQVAAAHAGQHEVRALDCNLGALDLGQGLLGDEKCRSELAAGLLLARDLEASGLKDKVLVGLVYSEKLRVNGNSDAPQQDLGVYHGVGIIGAADVLLAGSARRKVLQIYHTII